MVSTKQLASLKKLSDLFESGNVNQQKIAELSSLINNLPGKSPDDNQLVRNHCSPKPAFKHP